MMVGEDVEVIVTSVGSSTARLSVKHTAVGGRITFEDSFERDVAVGDSFSLPGVGGGTCEVVAIRDGKVRLGFDAPPHVSIHRREVYEAIRRHRRDDHQH